MSRRDTDKDLERPHFYSQYWVAIARQYAKTGSLAGMPGVGEMMVEEDDFDDLPPERPTARVVQPAAPIEPEIDDLPLPLVTRPTAKPAKPRTEKAQSSLSSFADLAALGFGSDMEMEELPVRDEDDAESVISRIGSNFDNDDEPAIEPDQEEAASLEALSEEEDWDDDEEEDDGSGVPRHTTRPIKPIRPRRDRGF
jgi:hypothetical protein